MNEQKQRQIAKEIAKKHFDATPIIETHSNGNARLEATILSAIQTALKEGEEENDRLTRENAELKFILNSHEGTIQNITRENVRLSNKMEWAEVKSKHTHRKAAKLERALGEMGAMVVGDIGRVESALMRHGVDIPKLACLSVANAMTILERLEDERETMLSQLAAKDEALREVEDRLNAWPDERAKDEIAHIVTDALTTPGKFVPVEELEKVKGEAEMLKGQIRTQGKRINELKEQIGVIPINAISRAEKAEARCKELAQFIERDFWYQGELYRHCASCNMPYKDGTVKHATSCKILSLTKPKGDL